MKKYRLRSRKPSLTAVGIRCADHATPSTRKRLALTSPTSGGRSVGIVRLRTTATEFSLVYNYCYSTEVQAARRLVLTGRQSFNDLGDLPRSYITHRMRTAKIASRPVKYSRLSEKYDALALSDWGNFLYIVFARSNTGFESHSRHGCLCLFCVCVVLCIGRGLSTG
jgi:hypothetical protein